MVRAFVGISFPEELLDALEEISGRLKGLQLDGRFARRESLHLTLKFLGSIPEEAVEAARDLLRHSVRALPVFEVEVRGLGVFPHLAQPRVVWIGVRAGEELAELQRRIEEAFEGRGFPKENRPYHPHLTLVRLKSQKNLRGLVEYLQGHGIREEAGRATVTAVHLYQSILHPQGAEYRKLLTVELGTGVCS